MDENGVAQQRFTHQRIKASAGSGKTHQLTNRYLALLAAGVSADAILATTFTRKAAAEILDRVLARLGRAASDPVEAEKLAGQIQHYDGKPLDFTALLRQLLCGLHRLRVGTLDSFYNALAGSFSLELGLPAGWSVCEDADDKALQRDALEQLLEQRPEDIGKLFPLLNKGGTKRSVQTDLHSVIDKHYECFRGSEQPAWYALDIPVPVSEQEVAAALERLHAFDFSANKVLSKARDEDIAAFEKANWGRFIEYGLAGKLFDDEDTYKKKEIPTEAQEMYEPLLRHARYELVRQLAQQTQATWDLLEHFHRELWPLKQTTGKLRFNEVTWALVESLHRETLRLEGLAFRLDGAIHHLLLDEFQDTALPQWNVFQPLGRAITHANEELRSFFCVGDNKQAIYRWRGGMSEIFEQLPAFLGNLDDSLLVESRRSAQPIIDVINTVFGNLRDVKVDDKCLPGLTSWSSRFEKHSTAQKQLHGHVCLHTGPAQREGQGIGNHRAEHCQYVAEKMKPLLDRIEGCSVGVLCRQNEMVARMIYELRHLNIPASEEGGNPLVDSPAVELMLSLFTLIDHPGHSIAAFHLQTSPLNLTLGTSQDSDCLASKLRRELLEKGYGHFAQCWAKRLAPACNQRDLSRLQQFVELAYDYQARATLRTDDFVLWVRNKPVPDPSSADVRVMTIHKAKGLQFDVVVLPELDSLLSGQPPTFVAGHDEKSLEVNFVCRYAKEKVQKLLSETALAAFAEHRRQVVEESLSLLYVAMTRPVHALHLFIPGKRRERGDAWFKLLRHTLAPGRDDLPEREVLFEHGDPEWFKQTAPATSPSAVSVPTQRLEPIAFRAGKQNRPRGLEFVAPSSREGGGRVALRHLFEPSPGTGTAAGTLYHEWFSKIAWLDDGLPPDDQLRAAAARIRTDLPTEIWHNLEIYLANFRAWLANPAISSVLSREAYCGPLYPGFPPTLAAVWTSSMAIQKVEQERSFLIREGNKLWNGIFDRVVWLGNSKQTLAADVLDFKTDAIPVDNETALAARTEHYRPQLEAYRQAVARLAQLPPERVATRLLFLSPGRVVEI
jgi:ATP-dependent exoDNAse (exonuclease V) beta subunit